MDSMLFSHLIWRIPPGVLETSNVEMLRQEITDLGQ